MKIRLLGFDLAAAKFLPGCQHSFQRSLCTLRKRRGMRFLNAKQVISMFLSVKVYSHSTWIPSSNQQ